VALIVALRQVVTWQVMSWRAMIWLTSDTGRDRDIGIVPKASAGGVVAGRPIRSALNVAGSAVGLLMIGWLALPGQVASEEPDLDPAEQVAEQPAPTPARIALAETNAAAVDVALSLDLPAAAGSRDAPTAQRALRRRPSTRSDTSPRSPTPPDLTRRCLPSSSAGGRRIQPRNPSCNLPGEAIIRLCRWCA